MVKLFALLFSLGWLISDHYPPWLSFHNDIFFAFSFITFLAFSLTKIKSPKIPIDIVVSVILLIAIFTAFVNSQIHKLYITDIFFPTVYIAFFAASVATPLWLKSSTLNTPVSGIILYAAIIASIASVYLQLKVWLGVNPFGLAIYYSSGGSGTRPYANLAQPNLLGTLLLWGLIGLTWLRSKKEIGYLTFGVSAVFILFGIALTQSRTALLGLTLVTLFAGIYAFREKSFSIFINFFTAWIILILMRHFLPILDTWLLGGEMPDRDFFNDNARVKIWLLTVEGILHSPYIGWGLRDLHPLVLQHGDYFTSLGATISKTHNIALDLIVWFGIPIAFLIILSSSLWLVKILPHVRNNTDLASLLALVTILVHSMLEFPHQYLFFIIPTGIFIGSLNLLVEWRPLLTLRRYHVICLLFLSAVVTVFIGAQYLKVEEEFRNWRFHNLSIGLKHEASNVNFPIFDKYHEFLRASRLRPLSDGTISENERNILIRAINAKPTPGMIINLALHYKAAGQEDLSKKWLDSLCAITPPEQCLEYRKFVFPE